MRFLIGEKVFTQKEGIEKNIIDSEIIDNQEIYYMSDKTSYSKSQLISDGDKFIKELLDNKEKITSLINYKQVAKNWVEWYNRKKVR
jgi:hypothetical protein